MMTLSPFVLLAVLGSAVLHAGWNVGVRRQTDRRRETALILVGAMMVINIVKIPWGVVSEAAPAFLTMALMPLTYSISYGVIAGELREHALCLAACSAPLPRAPLNACLLALRTWAGGRASVTARASPGARQPQPHHPASTCRCDCLHHHQRNHLHLELCPAQAVPQHQCARVCVLGVCVLGVCVHVCAR